MSDEQLPSEDGAPPCETDPGETIAGSISSCEETETEVPGLEQPHPLDPQRDQIVSLLLQRYISYRTETQ